MIRQVFSAPEMKNLPVLFSEDVHHGQLHIVGVSLALVIRLIRGLERLSAIRPMLIGVSGTGRL
jgi:hypothetical protein